MEFLTPSPPTATRKTMTRIRDQFEAYETVVNVIKEVPSGVRKTSKTNDNSALLMQTSTLSP